MNHTAQTFLTPDGMRLYSEFDEVANPRAALLFSHGFAEHLGRYEEMVSQLTEAGFSCYRFDYRGHGHSEGQRCHIFSFDDYITDFNCFRKAMIERTTGLKRFVLSFSNGGLIAFHCLSQDPQGIDGLVLNSPFFGFQFKVPAWKAHFGRLFSTYLPALPFPTGLSAKALSHDSAIVSSYSEDPMVSHLTTPRWFTETNKAQDKVTEAALSFSIPVLMQLGSDDEIASTPRSEKVFAEIASQDKTMREYPGFYHEVWNESNRELSRKDLLEWLDLHTAEQESH